MYLMISKSFYKLKTNFNLLFITSLLIIFFISCSNKDFSEKKPINVLLISMDTLRADRLGCFGNPLPISPNIDRLAKESIIFNTAYTTINWTLPSHVTMMTGLFPFTHGVLNQASAIAPDQQTIANILSDQGYLCVAFTGGGFVSSDFGFGYGFNSGYNQGYETIKKKIDIKQNTFEASDWIEKHYKSPFFMFFHSYQVHDPYWIEPIWAKLFGQEIPELNLDLLTKFDPLKDQEIIIKKDLINELLLSSYLGLWSPGKLATLTKDAIINRYISKEWSKNAKYQDTIKTVINLYDASVRYADFWVGKLIRKLKELGIYEKTLIIFLSDHGDAFMDHQNLSHWMGFGYDELMHIPMIIKIPQSEEAGNIKTFPVSTVDLLPTIISLTHFPTQKSYEGFDIFSKNTLDQPIKSVFFEMTNDKPDQVDEYDIFCGIIDDNGYKYFCLVGSDQAWLYNLKEDAAERNNLAGMKLPIEKKLATQINNFLAHLDSAKTQTTKATPDNQTLDQLKALGYIE